MNRKQRELIKTAYYAPPPKNKRAFLGALPRRKISLPSLIKSQFFYINPRIWVIALIFLILGIYQAQLPQDSSTSFWVIGSVLPFFAFTCVNELAKSDFFGMRELEQSSKVSLFHIVLSRIGILAAAQLILLISLQLMLYKKSGLSFLEFGFYFNLPLIISVFGSLFIINRVKTIDAKAVCALVCFGACFGGLVLLGAWRQLLQSSYFIYWFTITVIIIFGIIKEILKFIKSTEECRWNFFLTD